MLGFHSFLTCFLCCLQYSPTKHPFPYKFLFEIFKALILKYFFQLNMISSISLPSSAINCNKLISNSLHITSHSTTFNRFSNHKNPHKTCDGLCYSPITLPFTPQPLIHQISSSSGHRRCSLVAFDGNNSGPSEEDSQALDTVLKLYSAIKNKNIREISDIIGDECRCVCNFFSIQPFQGKKVCGGWFKNNVHRFWWVNQC